MRTDNGILALALLSVVTISAHAEQGKPTFPSMAPLSQYQEASAADEIALARSAAPPSISADADVMVLGAHGYETAAKGKNGFTCIVERAWASSFDAPDFWNPKVRAPICFNAASARTVLLEYVERTRWVLAGASLPEMTARTEAAYAAKTFVAPGPGAMCYMLSKQQYLPPANNHWHPHLMFFVTDAPASTWGADAQGSPVLSGRGKTDPFTTFMVPVAKWSDGTSAVMEMK
jgi:hypothetical protein